MQNTVGQSKKQVGFTGSSRQAGRRLHDGIEPRRFECKKGRAATFYLGRRCSRAHLGWAIQMHAEETSANPQGTKSFVSRRAGSTASRLRISLGDVRLWTLRGGAQAGQTATAFCSKKAAIPREKRVKNALRRAKVAKQATEQAGDRRADGSGARRAVYTLRALLEQYVDQPEGLRQAVGPATAASLFKTPRVQVPGSSTSPGRRENHGSRRDRGCLRTVIEAGQRPNSRQTAPRSFRAAYQLALARRASTRRCPPAPDGVQHRGEPSGIDQRPLRKFNKDARIARCRPTS